MDKKETKKIYDRANKFSLSDKVIICELVNGILKGICVKNIRPENLQQCPSHFISTTFEQREADIVYEVRDAHKKPYLYIFIEHQSKVDKAIPVRMLNYITSLRLNIFRESQKGFLPPALPILLYNGKRKWTQPLHVDDLVLPNILKDQNTCFHCNLIDERRYPVEDLLRIKGSMAAIIYMEQLNKKMFKENRETIVKNLEIMLEQVKLPQMITIGHWINNIFMCKLSESEVIKIAEQKEVITMLTEVLDDFRKEGILEGTEKGWQDGILEGTEKGRQDGILEGTERGRQDGILEGIRKTATAMVEKGVAVDFIHEVTGLSLEEIRGLGHTSQISTK